jgi:hypothetical protein
VVSIGTLDAEFVGSGGSWTQMTRALVAAGIVHEEAIPAVDLLWAFGTLIGNTDMHGGNLSFLTEQGQPINWLRHTTWRRWPSPHLQKVSFPSGRSIQSPLSHLR